MTTNVLFPNGYDPTWMEGMYACRDLGNGEWLSVIPLTLGRARLCVCEPGPMGNASLEHWCMDSPEQAIGAWWDYPELPEHWNRHQRRDRTHEYPVA